MASSYTAVVLDSQDRASLVRWAEPLVLSYLQPTGFQCAYNGKGLAHHMTCYLGPCREDHRDLLGQEVMLTLDAWGLSDRALALRVSEKRTLENVEVPCANVTPHVTLAVNVGAGGKPKDSNAITLWLPLPQPLLVCGVVREV